MLPNCQVINIHEAISIDKYLKRCIDTRLKDKLDSSGAVLN